MLEERKGKLAKHGVPYSEFVLCISPIQVHPPTREAPGCSLQIKAGLHLRRGCTCPPAHNASHWLVAK